MDYNTQRKKMVLPEYGRNVHRMVDHVKSIQDREDRNRAAKALIGIMGNLNPHLRDVTDFKHKLWDHLYIMADFELDVDSPYPFISKQKFSEKPNRVEYSNNSIRHKHYGKTMQNMILKASEFEDGEEKTALLLLIANHMKKTYLSWNKESVTDEEIFEDMYEMSSGRLKMDSTVKLSESRDLIPKTNNPKPTMMGMNKKKKMISKRK
ncbi:MAG: hypothetical protein A2W91_02935 [Bacteroidetes bacterium GWF2_38_335]|nr:MAG: hypothetical protein A2W91_02935 [Bacteroidetes bacterium GWF2_38_335]OFY77630.1 MAG: hypothetical protein A2281_01825 [Bacteroidetes bacterium RIFOXYA12_FULL_38_20]HBS87148.1 DUF4290 domain-containing protein [Bacteroidales bacterium]